MKTITEKKIRVALIRVCFTLPGSLHVHQCPLEPLIPVYVIVPGGVLLFLPFLICLFTSEELQDSICGWAFVILVGLFCFGWFICGE